ncbi:MAG: HAD-IA family hydrolase, partial [Burkholderiales bacterium]|nr:HAD-IA family hydrolase [Anaerolineae bacterium]
MIKAVLLDLDDTLLLNPERQFVAEYLALIDAHFTDLWQHQALSNTIMRSVKALVGERAPHLTNMDIVLNLIEADTGRVNADIISNFNDFYSDVYPVLKRLSSPAPGAVELVDFLRERGITLVIATNPLFPPDPVRQRLSWAGLSEDSSSYALVTTADVMHFMKPDPAYYAEIVARIGIEPDEALMVGDGIDNDIIAALAAGLHTYYVTAKSAPDDLPADAAGTLDNLRRLIYEEWLDTLSTHPPTPAMIAPELRGNVGTLFGMLTDVQPHFWEMRPDP